jgi:hypothetical protein
MTTKNEKCFLSFLRLFLVHSSPIVIVIVVVQTTCFATLFAIAEREHILNYHYGDFYCLLSFSIVGRPSGNIAKRERCFLYDLSGILV